MKIFLRRTAGPCFLALILGGVLASVYWIHKCRTVCDELVKSEETGHIIENVNVLASIRVQGKEKAIELKEDELSDHIWALSLAFSKDDLADSNSVRALRLAAAYRNQHPFSTGDTNKDQAVEAFLANFKTK